MRKLLLVGLMTMLSFADVTKTGNIVIDHDTGLMWQDEVNIPLYNWADAITYCSNVVIDNQAGWRLPSWDELKTIVDKSNAHPAIKDGFKHTMTTDYWTSTTNEEEVVYDTAFYISFNWGYVNGYANKSFTKYVRCVQ